MSEQANEKAVQKGPSIQEQLEEARKSGPGEPGAPVGDTGYFWDLSGSGEIPGRKGSRFVQGGDSRMKGLIRQHFDENDDFELNEHQLEYVTGGNPKGHNLLAEVEERIQNEAKQAQQRAEKAEQRKQEQEKARQEKAEAKAKREAEKAEKAQQEAEQVAAQSEKVENQS